MNRILIAILCVALAAGCDAMRMGDKAVEINNENVAGIWVADSFDTNMPMVGPEEKEAGKKEFLSSTYTLNEDHSFELHSNSFEAGAFGRWSLDPEKKELTMSYEMGAEHGVEIYTISELTTSYMNLRIDIPSMEAYVLLGLERKD